MPTGQGWADSGGRPRWARSGPASPALRIVRSSVRHAGSRWQFSGDGGGPCRIRRTYATRRHCPARNAGSGNGPGPSRSSGSSPCCSEVSRLPRPRSSWMRLRPRARQRFRRPGPAAILTPHVIGGSPRIPHHRTPLRPHCRSAAPAAAAGCGAVGTITTRKGASGARSTSRCPI